MEQTITIRCLDKELIFPKGITLEQISKSLQSEYEHKIILAKVNNKLQELFKHINKDSDIEFITIGSNIGHKTYKRTATLILVKAVRDVIGLSKFNKLVVQYSLCNGYYCELSSEEELNQNVLDRIKSRMQELVAQDIPIMKRRTSTDEAIEIFEKGRLYDKQNLFRYRRASSVSIYSLEDFQDYYYGYMAPSTGYIKTFDLYPYDEGFVLDMPDIDSPEQLSKFEPSKKLFKVLKEATRWGEMLSINTVGALNNTIADGGIEDLILVQEALQEKKIAEIAEEICDNPSKRIILIAGPSSSGKTTFSHRLSIQLRAHGMIPHPIPVDDYFVDREKTPFDEEGKPDYESLDAIDVDQFNEDMIALLRGEEVELPFFNFITGKREYKGNNKMIGKKDILVIEGIHGINDQLTYSLHKDNKFKIYISALSQLNIDEHNRIPTTDGRLIRRIVRDAAKRGSSATKTIAMWNSVRKGEERNIFPFQEDADIMFNSALIYELAVLKQYAEPLLFGIDKSQPEYDEAKRLLKFLDYFLGVSCESIPKNSIIREFIGNAYFKV